jgi:flagellar biosynthesis protein FlhF
VELRSLRAAIGRLAAIPDVSAELDALRGAIAELAPEPKGRAVHAVRAAGIEGRVGAELARAIANARDDLDDALREAIRDRIAVAPWPIETTRRRAIALVGPAGVGKTTTLAKLAAQARLAGQSVAVVSCDDFRVGAAHQLERYAELLDASFHVARSQADVERVAALERADLVFFDTCGRPPTSASPEMALRTMQGALERFVLLCLPASTRACDAERAAASWSPMRPSAIAITKIDETRSPSALVHAPAAAKLPLAVLCFGPQVPEDVASADRDDFAARLIPEHAKRPAARAKKTAEAA